MVQWSFRGGTRGNAFPIVKIPLERMGTAFPLLSYGENAYVLLKMHFAVQKRCFLDHKLWQNAGGAYDAPQTPLVGWGGDTPPQTPLRSASILAPSALDTVLQG